MKKLFKNFVLTLLVILSPLVFVFLYLLSLGRRCGIEQIQFYRKIFEITGIFPLRDHYYEPLYNSKHLHKPLSQDRILKSVDMNIDSQLELLQEFNYSNELEALPFEKDSASDFYFNNGGFEAGDAEILYSFIRHFKPEKIIEIGSGNSTLIAIEAIIKNQIENVAYSCKHICIEPFEMPWLEEKNVILERTLVEKIDKKIFKDLKENDILFIDSSHVIRPQGDVLFEYLEILPELNSGVLIHIHDIFTPKDYPEDWIIKKVRFWNEQYLLEAFLSFNDKFKVISALNFLKHNFFSELIEVCPVLKKNVSSEPGSFWIKRI